LYDVNTAVIMLLGAAAVMTCNGLCWCCAVLFWLRAAAPVQDRFAQPVAPVQEALVLFVLLLGCCCVLV
jgi:hypothetical protein